MKKIFLVLVVIQLSFNCHSQFALDGDSSIIQNTSVLISIEKEMWLDSIEYQFLAITLSQPINLIGNKQTSQNFSVNDIYFRKWSKIDGVWINNGDCNMHPIRYLHYDDSSNRNMRALYLLDDFNLTLIDSITLTINTSSGYLDRSNMDFLNYNKMIKLDVERIHTPIAQATVEWFTNWMSTQDEYSLWGIVRYQMRDSMNACKCK